MASLRKRPEVTPEIASDDAPVATDTNASPAQTPAPELASSQDEATLALQKQIDELKKSEELQRQVNDAQIAMQAAKERREAWLASTPIARENIAELGRIHHDALRAGLADTSPEYFLFLESELAALNSGQPAEAATRMAEEMHERAAKAHAPEPPSRPSSLYSAPVSRDPPTADGPRSNRRVTLTPQEVEMARVSNISIEEYGRQKLKLQTMKATGEYSEDNRR